MHLWLYVCTTQWLWLLSVVVGFYFDSWAAWFMTLDRCWVRRASTLFKLVFLLACWQVPATIDRTRYLPTGSHVTMEQTLKTWWNIFSCCSASLDQLFIHPFLHGCFRVGGAEAYPRCHWEEVHIGWDISRLLSLDLLLHMIWALPICNVHKLSCCVRADHFSL